MAGIVDPASAQANFADTGALGACLGASSMEVAPGRSLVPTSFTASDPAAACPPTQAQVNAGIVGCALAIVNGRAPSTRDPDFSDGPTPAAPTVSMAPAGKPGEIFAVTASGWWGGGTQSVPSTTPPIPGFTTLVGATPAANTLTATAPVYCATGHTSTASPVSPPGPCSQQS